MKRLTLLLLLLLSPAQAFAFEEAMHLYLAHEAFRNMRIKQAGTPLAAPPYPGWIDTEYQTLGYLLLTKNLRGECKSGAGKDLCDALTRRLELLDNLSREAQSTDGSSAASAADKSPVKHSSSSREGASSRGGASSASGGASSASGGASSSSAAKLKPPQAYSIEDVKSGDHPQLEVESSLEGAMNASIDLFFPFKEARAPFKDADGMLVPAPFATALSTLGDKAFLRNFLAGVLGPDSFPDIFTGPVVAHRDWSSASLRAQVGDYRSGRALEAMKQYVDVDTWRGWKSWQWADYLLEQAKDRALFQRIADREWSADRRYWGKKYATKDAFTDRLQAEATAFAYGYWVHCAQDGVAHEMVSAFNGGAFDYWRLLPGRNSIVEERHSAIETYLLEKVKPWTWRYSTTLTDISIPVPFLREVLMQGKGMEMAPVALHLRAFDAIKHASSELLSCGGEWPTCDGKDVPAVLAAIDCVDQDSRCYQKLLCGMVKKAYPDQDARIREARDGWLLLSLAIARYHAFKSVHPDSIVDSNGELARDTTIPTLFTMALERYDLEVPERMERYGSLQAAGKPYETQVSAALELYVDRFLLPALAPMHVEYNIGESGDPYRSIQLDDALKKQIEVDCGDMVYTNVSGICEVTKSFVDGSIQKFKAISEAILGEVRAQLFTEAIAKPGANASPERSDPAGSQCQSTFFATPDIKVNRVYPGTSCSAPPGWCRSCEQTEDPVSREIKRRVERFAGLNGVAQSSEALKVAWALCDALEKNQRAHERTGKERGDCWTDYLFLSMIKGDVGDEIVPQNYSPWIRRALTLTGIAMISDLSVDRMVGVFEEKRGFSRSSDCIKALHKDRAAHPLAGVQASLVGKNDRSGNHFVNGFYDELKWGRFGLYQSACSPLASAILPPVPDTNSNGINDIYDTCPDWTCQVGWKNDPDPKFDHVGRECSGAPKADKRCIAP